MGKKKGMTAAEKREAMWGWAFILPTMIGLIVLNFYPVIQTVYQSFCKTGDFGKGNIFIGFGNYQKLLADGEVWQSLWNTIKYAIIEVPFSVVIALLLAVLLNRKMKGVSVYRTIFFLPMVCAPAAVAMVWKWLYNQQFGLLNNIFHSKADIDGASEVRQFFNITVPLLSPTTFFIVQTRIIGALTVFDLMFMVMDKTNVALSKVQSVVYLFYQYSFTNGNKGMGSALVMILVVFIMILTFILQQAEKKLVYHA